MLTTQSANRTSHVIGQRPAANLLNAINLAERLGLPLTQFITINFSRTHYTADTVSAAFRSILKPFGRWMRTPKRRAGFSAVQPAYVWVVENHGGCLHVHWLVHVPEKRLAVLAAKLPAWVSRETGGLTSGAIHFEDVDRPHGAGKYICKGIDPRFAPLYRIDFEYQGPVVGKRSGFTENLGPTARKRHVEAGVVAPLNRVYGRPAGRPFALHELH